MLCNISQASKLLGYRSRSVLQRLVQAGRLTNYERGRQGRSILLEMSPVGMPPLADAVRSLTTMRVGSPLCDASATKDWEAFAMRCNAMLDHSLWGPPPWSADRWAGLAGVLMIANNE
jgi:hypothetical protein